MAPTLRNRNKISKDAANNTKKETSNKSGDMNLINLSVKLKRNPLDELKTHGIIIEGADPNTKSITRTNTRKRKRNDDIGLGKSNYALRSKSKTETSADTYKKHQVIFI